MAEKLKSIESVDEACSNVSANMQKLKALVRTYGADSSVANALAMAEMMAEIEANTIKIRGKLANVVAEVASKA